jgi:hypothetical protein
MTMLPQRIPTMSIPETTVRDMGELIHALRRLAPDFGRTEYWFRGHTRYRDWPLVPSAYRYFDREGERQLALRFQIGAVGRSPTYPAGEDLGSWLVLMQHYGLPTRLLDWSRSLLVATYFAVAHEPIKEDAVVWLLAPEALNQRAPFATAGICVLNGDFASQQVRPLAEAAFRERECDPGPYAVLSQDVDVRVMVQSGAFTIHGTATPLEEHPQADQFLARFIIPAASRDTFREELFAMGARRSLIFPDLHNLAIELAQRQGTHMRITDRQV